MVALFARLLRYWRKDPTQLPLPFHCSNYGRDCVLVHDLSLEGAFYTGRCSDCGSRYEPVNDR